jgi:methyl-accepting chemotaxis protein
METKYKRSIRHFLTDKDLQLHLLAQSLIYSIVVVIVAIGIVLYPLISDMVQSQDAERQYQAARALIALAKWLVPAVIIVLTLFMGHMIVVTHRICGPLINFTHTFDKLAEGDLTRKVQLRTHDYLKSECERINHMIEGISGIIARLMTDHERLMVTLEGLKEQINDMDTKQRFEDALEMIRKDAAYVSETLCRFKVENQKD